LLSSCSIFTWESSFAQLQHEGLNHYCTITAGVGEQQCAAVLREFFAEQRAKKAAERN